MKTQKLFFKTVCLILTILLVIPLMISCKERPLGQTKLAKKEVGTVGDYTVLYEEFYFVANNYYNAMKGQYANNPDALKKAVWEKTSQSLSSNYYAILALCEAEGISYDPNELKNDIKDYIKHQIETDFDGSRKDYLQSQQNAGLTDHYVRFTIGVEMLYSKLATKYQESGVIPNTDAKLKAYMKENLIHTWHLAVVVNEGEDRAQKLSKAENLLQRLNNGESFFSLMKYSEDFSSNTLSGVDGTYFHKGEMTQEYEDVSLSLKINEYSDIVTSTARQSDGSMLECFYIIQRLPIDDNEIEKNFHSLSDTITSAIVAEKLNNMRDSLEFTPNEYAKTLDVTNLEQPKNGLDYQLVLIISSCVLTFAIIATSVIIFRNLKLKRFRNQMNIK